MSRTRKIFFSSAFGGILCGFHLRILFEPGAPAPWVFFNLVLGGTLLFFATLMSEEGQNKDNE